MSTYFHPDKGGDPKIQEILNDAKTILERAFTTESGQRDLKIYECISKIATPRTKQDLKKAEQILDCAQISTYQRCASIENAANRVLNQIAWVGGYAKEQLSYAYSCVCLWQDWWDRRFNFLNTQIQMQHFSFSGGADFPKFS